MISQRQAQPADLDRGAGLDGRHGRRRSPYAADIGDMGMAGELRGAGSDRLRLGLDLARLAEEGKEENEDTGAASDCVALPYATVV
jgi:hypothetical protein